MVIFRELLNYQRVHPYSSPWLLLVHPHISSWAIHVLVHPCEELKSARLNDEKEVAVVTSDHWDAGLIKHQLYRYPLVMTNIAA